MIILQLLLTESLNWNASKFVIDFIEPFHSEARNELNVKRHFDSSAYKIKSAIILMKLVVDKMKHISSIIHIRTDS